jgi:hypothetical protein
MIVGVAVVVVALAFLNKKVRNKTKNGIVESAKIATRGYREKRKEKKSKKEKGSL